MERNPEEDTWTSQVATTRWMHHTMFKKILENGKLLSQKKHKSIDVNYKCKTKSTNDKVLKQLIFYLHTMKFFTLNAATRQ